MASAKPIKFEFIFSVQVSTLHSVSTLLQHVASRPFRGSAPLLHVVSRPFIAIYIHSIFISTLTVSYMLLAPNMTC